MSYFLADADGPREEFASIGGYANFRAWALRQAAPVKRFVQLGFSEDLEELADALAEVTAPGNMDEQRRLLLEVAQSANAIVIVSDGMSDEDDFRTAYGVAGRSGHWGHTSVKGRKGGSAPGKGGGALTAADEELIQGDWAYPNSNPNGHSYEDLRDPSTPSGQEMTKILNKLPVRDGVTYRGVSIDPRKVRQLVSAKGYELKLHSSASTEAETALIFAGEENEAQPGNVAVIMELHGRGRDINAFLPEELLATKEIVHTAGTRYRFKSLSHEKFGRLAYMRVVLEEVR